MYRALATVYDLYQPKDWTLWADYICALDQQYSQRGGSGDGSDGRPILLDLGCGTGSFSLEMAKRGFDPIGIDQSLPMLNEAQKKAAKIRTDGHRSDCLFLRQDITSFELYGTVDLIVCLMDTMNHLMSIESIDRLFSLCAHYLNPGCLMVFDLLTGTYLSQTLGDEFFFDDQTEYTIFWQNQFDQASQISESHVTLFSRLPDSSYRRADEMIQERYYSQSQIRASIARTSFEMITVQSNYVPDPPRDPEERTFYVLRKPV